jgi:hypothetical protein
MFEYYQIAMQKRIKSLEDKLNTLQNTQSTVNTKEDKRINFESIQQYINDAVEEKCRHIKLSAPKEAYRDDSMVIDALVGKIDVK